MKYLSTHWKFRAFVILLISIVISILMIFLDQTAWADGINLNGYSHGEEEGGEGAPRLLMLILPFVKEIILIGVPMLISVWVIKLVNRMRNSAKPRK